MRRPGGTRSRTWCPTGWRITWAWNRPPVSSGPTTCSSSPPCCAPGTTASPSFVSARATMTGPRSSSGPAWPRSASRSCAGHAAAGGPISLLRFPEGGLADVVYLEQLATGVYLTRPAETIDYWSALNHLATQARPPAAAPSILRKILAEDYAASEHDRTER